MEKAKVLNKITLENFMRMKYLSLIFLFYVAFILLLDFGPVKVWDDDSIGIYRILDIILTIFTIAVTIFFWFYRKENIQVINFLIKFSILFVLIWSGIVTGIELNNLGFSTLIFVVLILAFYNYINLITSIVFFSGAFIALIGTVMIRKGLDDSSILMITILLPIILISILISIKNYKSKVNELINTEQLNELNTELNTIKENLEDKVRQRTTEFIKAKEKAEESDRLKSAFLANMSHEIRTPMNGILGFAELLKEPELSGEVKDLYIKIIEEGGERMLNIINNLVDISKLESRMTKILISETNINEQLEYIYSFFKPEVENKGMQLYLKSDLKENESIVKTDREKVYAILTNLVKNAIKYSKKGYIELGCEIIDTNLNTNDQAKLQFYIKDTGIGIPANRQTAVFERFIQAEIEDKNAMQGAGLGLSISKGYVELLGGKIWLESEEGKGSVFFFTIPYISYQTN